MKAVLPPKIYVVDFFKEKVVDIDGDNVDDLSHGEVVSRYAKAFCPSAEIVQYDVTAKDKPFEFFPSNFLKALATIKKDIKENSGQLSGVNFSIVFEVAKVLENTPASLKSMSTLLENDVLLKQFKESLFTNNVSKLIPFIDFLFGINKLIKKGAHVYAGDSNTAGNYTEFIATNATVVGALNAQDAPIRLDRKIDDLAQVDMFEQGIYSITKTEGGFDITGDDIADVFDDEVSGGESIWVRELDFMNTLLPLYKFSNEQKKKMQTEGFSILDFFEYTYVQKKSNPVKNLIEQIKEGRKNPALYKPNYFILGDDGKIIFDPDYSGRKNTVNVIQGASFATPTALGKKLQKEYEKQLGTMVHSEG